MIAQIVELQNFLFYTSPILFAELAAALAGSYYLSTTPHPFKNSAVLVCFLWLTLVVELVGCYAPIAYFSDYNLFGDIKGTVWEGNFWLYNIYTVLSFCFFTHYFISFLRNSTLKIIGISILGVFLMVSIGILSYSDNLFRPTSSVISIFGTLLILLSVMFFYSELLRSDLLLQMKTFLPFYISVGVLVFNLCVTPIEIFSEYFKLGNGNRLFVTLHVKLMLFANIFLYSIFIFGFLLCSRKKKSS